MLFTRVLLSHCSQIEAFVPEYWGGEIYHDVDKAFYKVCVWLVVAHCQLTPALNWQHFSMEVT